MLLWVVLGSVVGCYLITSLLLLCFPTLLHTKKHGAVKCQHISHRGGALEEIENTMAAFRNAHSQGTEMFEIDIHLTKDEKIVVVHDDNLERLTETYCSVAKLDYDQLPLLVEPPGLPTLCTDRQILLLETLLVEFPDMPLNIDIKAHDNELLVDMLLDMLEKHNRLHNTVVGSMNEKVVQTLHRKNNNLLLMCSFKRVCLMTLAFYLGLLPFIPLKETYFEVPYFPTYLKQFKMALAARCILRVADFIFRSRVFYSHLQRRGIQVYMWVVNDTEDIRDCFENLKADGVMTDRPTLLRDYIDDAFLLDLKK